MPSIQASDESKIKCTTKLKITITKSTKMIQKL